MLTYMFQSDMFAQVFLFLFRIKTLSLPSPSVRSECGTSHLQLQGINVIAYLDDWVIWDTSHELTARAVNTATCLLSKLGFLINVSKSHLLPSTDVEWLGIRWFPLLGHGALPEDKQVSILSSIRHVLSLKQVSRRHWEHILGKLNFVTKLLCHNQPLLQPNFVNFPLISTTQEERSSFGPILPFQDGEVTLYLIMS
ncbi:hypothetical protein Pcinc_009856 [Petrolisthes cinctipes]|uniref:Reverse transcriptase domain-containing protein n=1 Tax=Petrolisthes cinctipes TaxID=88211 RepID=A0AAE1G472_PETCI|nr:hypothetical protein Pcinc_009856 [Petrolisthes cinctipes]